MLIPEATIFDFIGVVYIFCFSLFFSIKRLYSFLPLKNKNRPTAIQMIKAVVEYIRKRKENTMKAIPNEYINLAPM